MIYKQLNFKMMKTKVLLFTFVSVFTTGFIFTSCEDEVAKPIISGLEVGIGDSHVAYIGADLHLDAEIIAEGKIDKVTVEIHKEDGTSDEIEAEYTEFSGLKNATFHKHVDIPATTTAGDYHLHLIVTDLQGNSTTVEAEIAIKELVDTEAPVITITSAPTRGQAFATGQTISISGTITDNISLASMLVALVYESDNIADAAVTGAAGSKIIVMLHTHDFGEDPDETEFTASIKVGATNDNNMTPAVITGANAWKSGNYYLLVKSKDAKANGAISSRYPIVINL